MRAARCQLSPCAMTAPVKAGNDVKLHCLDMLRRGVNVAGKNVWAESLTSVEGRNGRAGDVSDD